LSLSKAQLKKHFPALDTAEQERQRLASLPMAQQIAELMPHVLRTCRPDPLIGQYDDLL